MRQIVLVIGVVLVGCAGGDDDSGGPPSPSDLAAADAGHELGAEHEGREWDCTCRAERNTEPDDDFIPTAAGVYDWAPSEPPCAEFADTAHQLATLSCKDVTDDSCACTRCMETDETCRTRVIEDDPCIGPDGERLYGTVFDAFGESSDCGPRPGP